ncbi:hypothetical protein G7054_g4463 [Neopestalotiopsis clavispora]|nr:hypothetical protein G7054_g4463 [Neopestalotiopsis clavispora]
MASMVKPGRFHAESRSLPTMEQTSECPSLVGHLPQYFLVRPDVVKHTASGAVMTKGAMVPLIPIDQLPSWLEIADVPRELYPEDIKGLTNLGKSSKDFDTYNVCVIYHDNDCGTYEPRMTSGLDKIKNQHGRNSSGGRIITGVRDEPDSNSRGHSQRALQNLRSDDLVTTPGEHDVIDERQVDTHDDMESGSSRHDDSSYELSASPNSSETCASVLSNSTDKELFSSLRVKKGIEESRHAPETTDISSALVIRKQIPPSPTAGLNPRIPSSVPLRPREHCNPYGTLNHKRIVPSGSQAADSRYSPSQPSRSLGISDHRGGGGSGSSRYDVLGYSSPSSTTTTHRHDTNNDNRSLLSLGGGSSTTYCRHWCHHNTCKYGAECKYIHEMPKTLEGLSAVGLSDWPKWYKAEKYGYEKAMAEMRQSMNLNGHSNYPGLTHLGGPHPPSPLASTSRASLLTKHPEKQELPAVQHLQQHQHYRQNIGRYRGAEGEKLASKISRDKKKIKGHSSYSTSSKKPTGYQEKALLQMRQRGQVERKGVLREGEEEDMENKTRENIVAEEEQDLISLD